MSSILKILADSSCNVYCDFKLIGKLQSNSILRIELKVGTYILEFKSDDQILLFTQEFTMQSDETEQLLRIMLKPIIAKIELKKDYDKIAKRQIDIEGNQLIDKISKEVVHIKYNLNSSHFDKCGLLSINIGGEEQFDGFHSWYRGGKFGCINKRGDLQIPPIYDTPIIFQNKDVDVTRIDGKILFINRYGEVAFSNQYDDALYYIKDICCIKRNNKYGLINNLGQEITPIIYEDISLHETDEGVYASVKLNEKKGICDSHGAILIPIIYEDTCFNYSTKHISVFRENKYGVIDLAGSIIIPIEYEIIYPTQEGSITRRNGKLGCIKFNGVGMPTEDGFEELVPFIYDSIYDIKGNDITDNTYRIVSISDWNGEPKDEKISNCNHALSAAVYVKKENGLLHCTCYYKKREEYKKEGGNYPIIYHESVEIVDQFSCKSFCRHRNNVLILNGRYYIGDYFKDIDPEYGYDMIETVIHNEISTKYYALKDIDKWSIIEANYPYRYILTDIADDKFSSGTTEYGEYLITYSYSRTDSRKLYLINGDNTNFIGEYESIVHFCFYKDKNYFKGFFSICKNRKWAIATDNFSYHSSFIYDDHSIDGFNIANKNIRRTIHHEILNKFLQEETYGRKKILFIDVETTGLPLSQKLPYTETNNWPHLVQAGIIFECGGFQDGFISYNWPNLLNIIVAPNNYIIPLESTKIHGISNDYAIKYGYDRNDILPYLDLLLYHADIIIGHNIEFDLNVLKCEIFRIKGKNSRFIQKKHHIIDTMKIGASICKIPISPFSNDYKWPSLDELYYTLFNKSITKRHNAMADVHATYECAEELFLKGMLKL